MKRLLSLIALLSVSLGVSAQSIRDVRINEVLVNNEDSYMDDYGHRSSWIELHNTSHGRIKINGCYLKAIAADGSETAYRIPSDPNAELGPLGYRVFFCEGSATKGTFYTNFTLDDAVTLQLLNANGEDILDEIRLGNEARTPDVSFGRYTEQDGTVTLGALPQTTPMATNDMEDAVPKHERFRRVDPTGGIMTITAFVVVFSSLLVLFLVFKWFGNYMIWAAAKRRKATQKPEENVPAKKLADTQGNIEEIAAIAFALKLYMSDLHDKESEVLTINRVARTYSPWSSKIYGLRQIPQKK